jgi:LPXTG-motif cell wall-anchored protein
MFKRATSLLKRGLAAVAVSAGVLLATVSPAGATELALSCDGTIIAAEFGVPVSAFAFDTPITLPSGLLAVFTRVDVGTVHAEYTNPATGDTWAEDLQAEPATGCSSVPPTVPPTAPPTVPPTEPPATGPTPSSPVTLPNPGGAPTDPGGSVQGQRTLPVTGESEWPLVVAGGVAVALGALLIAWSRRSANAQ